MAGRSNQRRLAALQRLRACAGGQDDAVRARQQSTDAIKATESEIEELRADYVAKLAAIRAKRAHAVRRSAELLDAVAVLVGDDNDTARLLGVPLHQVHAAPRVGARRLRLGAGRQQKAHVATGPLGWTRTFALDLADSSRRSISDRSRDGWWVR